MLLMLVVLARPLEMKKQQGNFAKFIVILTSSFLL
jgi:hypothetical protein